MNSNSEEHNYEETVQFDSIVPDENYTIEEIQDIEEIQEVTNVEIIHNVNNVAEEEVKDIEELDMTKSVFDDLENERSNRYAQDGTVKKRIKKYLKKDNDLITEVAEEELPIIELYRVYKSYQAGVDAVKNINMRIKKGEFVFIVGKSGSGKTTIMNLLMNAIRPTSGRVYVNGFELTRLQKRKIARFRRGIGVVFQDFKLLNDRDVFENVAFAQRVIEKTTKQVNKNVPEVLSLVGLTDKQKALPTELSGGEQQRVAIARALVNQPSILLADEPTGNLDPNTAWEIMDLLEEINRRGTTVIVVTHNLEIVNAMKKRVITIDDGNIVEDRIKGE